MANVSKTNLCFSFLKETAELSDRLSTITGDNF